MHIPFIPGFVYETPEPTGGSGGGAATGQGTAPPPAQPSPGTPGVGQGQQQGESTADQFWGMFPTVPEEQRAVLEPHLKNVQGHVTKLEQQFAPFKPFVEAGYTPDQTAGLFSFAQEFDGNPLAAWLRMAQALQQPDEGGNRAIHEDLDLEVLAKIALGQELPPEEPQPEGDPSVAPAAAAPQGADMPEWAQSLAQQVQAINQRFQSQDQIEQQRSQDRLLQTQFENMRNLLTGEDHQLPQEAVTNERLRAALIVSNGNVQQAIKNLIDERSIYLKNHHEQITSGRQPLAMPNGQPKPPSPEPSSDNGDGFAKARGGALNFLKRQNQAAAQG